MSTDAELLQRYVRENSESAFAGLVQRHLTLVYSAALRQVNGDTHLAEDVAQTVFTALARKAASLTCRATLAGWLYLSTHHAAAQAVRGNRRREAREQEAQVMHDVLGSSTPATDWDRARPVLDAAMRELNESDREAVLLRFFERRPFAEIGAALNLTEDAARMRVDRALEKLRTLLARRGITSTSAALAGALGEHAMVAAPAGLAASVTGAAFATGVTGIFMSIPLIIASAVAIAAIGSAAFEIKQVHRTEAAVAAVSVERNNLRGQLQQVQQRVVLSDQELAAAQGEVASLRASRPAVPVTGGANVTAEAANAQRIMEENRLKKVAVEVALRRKARVEQFDVTNRPLYRLTGFSAEQIAQFKALTLENWSRHDEVAKIATAQGLTPNDPSTQMLSDQLDADYRNKLRAAFGETACQTIEHFNETQPIRQVIVGQFVGQLFYTDTPLTPMQAEQIVEVLSANMRNASGKLDQNAMNVDAALAQLQAVLSPPQLEGLSQILKH